MRKVVAKINLENIRHNAATFAKWTGKPICAVVKANAYGHGAEAVVNALESLVQCFAVALYAEAVAIRMAACGKDILILSPTADEKTLLSAMQNGFILTVADVETARNIQGLAASNRLRARVHLKVNTGMNRYGLDVGDLETVRRMFYGDKYVSVEGIYSHLYGGKKRSANAQRKRFVYMCSRIKEYFPNAIAHLGATYGALLGEEFALDMTRIGIGLYGYFPDGAKGLAKGLEKRIGLRKAMQVWAETTSVRTYQTGGVGYGKAYVKRGTVVSVLRVGYADGFLRRKRNGIVGFTNNANNLCMDACLQTQKRRWGEWVPVLLDASRTARITGTITYEVLCAATRRAEMVYDDVAVYGNGGNA